MSDCCTSEVRSDRERKFLWVALILNFVMFVVGFIAGRLGDYSGLIAVIVLHFSFCIIEEAKKTMRLGEDKSYVS